MQQRALLAHQRAGCSAVHRAHPPLPQLQPAAASGRRCAPIRATAPDDPGVRSLLDRDRSMAGLSAEDLVAADAFLEEAEREGQAGDASAASAAAPSAAVAASPPPPTTASTPATTAAKAAATKARKRGGAKADVEEKKKKEDDGIATCRAALDAGEAALRGGDAAAALALFERALDLPGSAAVRLAGRPVEVSVPSDGEAAAALYNMACCYAALGQVQAGVTVLGAALDSPGSLDRRELAAGVAGDPDLEPLRSAPGFAALARAAAAAAAAGGGGGDGGPGAAAGSGGPLGLLAGVFGGGGKGKKAGGDGGVIERMMRPW